LQPYVPESDLFLTFSAIDPASDVEILNFANAYGLLGGGPLLLPRDPQGMQPMISSTAALEACVGEPRSLWLQNILDMKAAVWLWQGITSENTNQLATRIHWVAQNHVEYVGPPLSATGRALPNTSTIASPERPELLKRLLPGDTLMAARLYLQELLNQKLAESITERLLWTPGWKKIGKFLTSKSLAGCLWDQLASAAAELRTIRNCAACGEQMLIAPEGSGYRGNRKTCSNACRMKLYFARKHRAQALHQKGLSVETIAKRLGTDVKRLRKWI
jgi:hypothetical protein